MCLRCKSGNTAAIQQLLLDENDCGVIAFGPVVSGIPACYTPLMKKVDPGQLRPLLRAFNIWFFTIAIVANAVPVLFLMLVVMKIFDAGELGRVTRLLDATPPLIQLLWSIVPFAPPILINLLYILPIERMLRAPAADWAGEAHERGRRRLLNLPLVTSLIGMTGWLTSLLFGIILLISLQPDRLGELLVVYLLGQAPTQIATAGLCFVFSYYSLDLLNRRYLVPLVFPDGVLSGVRRAWRLPVVVRFLIQFFATVLVPALFLVFALLAVRGNQAAFGSALLMLGVFVVFALILTLLLARTFQGPLRILHDAVTRIGGGDYSSRVSVTTVDELGRLGEGVNRMAADLARNEFVRETFGKIVDPAIRDHLLGGNLKLGGEVVTASLLFSDIRDFTAISERLPPGQVVELLNRYFAALGAAVTAEHGLVNKFIGDSIMALFGVPVPDPGHADAALRAAIAMQQASRKLGGEFRAAALPEFATGIGLHSGSVLAGNIGSQTRMEYTVIGDAVNLASRIEGLTRYFGAAVIFSGELLGRLADPGAFRSRFLGKLRVKGKQEPVSVFEALDACPEDVRERRLSGQGRLERAIGLYHERAFGEACGLLEPLVAADPEDRVPVLYLERCRICERDGVPPGWDGVERLMAK